MDKPTLYLPHLGFNLESGFTVEFTTDGDFFVDGKQIYGMNLMSAISVIMDWKQLSEHEEAEIRYNQPSRKREKPDKECDIYFIKDDLSGLTKIGRAKCAKSRFNGMLTANPRIELLFYYRATESIEKAWHEKLSDFREYREWFRLDEGILGAIERVVNKRNQAQ